MVIRKLFIESLNKRQRQVLPIIERGVKMGLSGNRILRALRAGGMGIGRQAMQKIVRHIKGIELGTDRLKSLHKDVRPNPSYLPEAKTKLKRKYAFTFRVRGVIGDSGTIGTQYITMSTDTVLSRAKMEAKILTLVGDELTGYSFSDPEVMLVEGVRAGPAGTLL